MAPDICCFLCGNHLLKRIQNRYCRWPGKHLHLLLSCHITKRELHEKPVNLCIRQRKGSVRLQRIFCSHDKKRLFQFLRHPIHSNLMFFHGFQKTGLSSRCSPINLVCQNHIRKQRTWAELELSLLLIIKINPCQIRGNQIWCKLNPLKITAHSSCKSPQQHGLSCSWNILQKHMPGTYKTGKHKGNHILLTHNNLGTIVYDFFMIILKI